MLGGVRLKVGYIHEKTCFAYISPKYSNNVEAQSIQVLAKDKRILLWVVYSSSVPEGQISCNPIFSRMVGLEEGSEVFVSPYSDVKVLDELFVDTDSPDDQEILEHNAELLQLRILDQLRLVVANQKAVIWLSVSLPIIFTPKQTGLLVNHSRVVVKVDAFNNFHNSPSKSVEPKPVDVKFKNIGIINQGMLAPYLNIPKKLALRALLIDSDGKRNLIHPYTVFVHEDLLDSKCKDLTVILATMQNISLMANKGDVNDLCVEIVLIDNVVYKSLCREVYDENIPTVLIPKSLNTIINLENGVQTLLTVIGDKVEQPDHIDIETYADEPQSENDVVEKFKNCVIENTHSGKKFLINHGMVKQNPLICKGYLKFNLTPKTLKYTMLYSESFRHCTIKAKCLPEKDLEEKETKQIKPLDYDNNNYCRTMKSIQTILEKILSHIYFETHRAANFDGVSEIKSNILITGQSGSGKTALCHMIQKELTLWSKLLYCRSINTRDPTRFLKGIIQDCKKHKPSVLICDDLDSVLPAENEANPHDNGKNERMAALVTSMLTSCAGVCVVVTCGSPRSLPAAAAAPAHPLYTAHFHIQELQLDERVELLKHHLHDRIREQFTIDDDDFTKMAAETAGYSVREINDYIQKILFKAVKKKSADNPKPRLVEDIRQDTEKAKAFDIWGPIGGMEEVKRELTECIFWPIMYPALFPSASCGILLYGPPGTGKSYIGSCMAKMHNMNFILVKGPELLSKYIGQSEKAVRDIFDKADMKRPCILFFDEFDSLAPKRGHDSTGVTDRVVNQLLARLDGAEGGARGPVLAATARPDLLDPALLRANRLERHVYCPPPDQAERLAVLRVLVRSAAVSADVQLEQLAERTAGYSAADLKALLVTAQLAKLETQLISSEDKKIESVVITPAEIEHALSETRPSLSPEQRLYYDTIYKRFRGETLSAEQQALSARSQRARVTLA